MTENKEPAIMTTDRLFGEKVMVPPAEYDIRAMQYELQEKYGVLARSITTTDKKERMEQIEACVREQGKEHDAWCKANSREASLIAFEEDRVLCRLGNKLEWFHISAVELVAPEGLS